MIIFYGSYVYKGWNVPYSLGFETGEDEGEWKYYEEVVH